MEPHFQFFRSNLIKYYTSGKGEPLFLIHGYQADSRIWERMIPLLQDKFELIIPDLPGHGDSPLIQTTNTMEFLSEIIYSIALARGYNGISIAGHSMGGYIALAFAEKYWNLTDGLTLINAHPFEDSITKQLGRNREADLINQGRKELLLLRFIHNNFSPSEVGNLKEEIKQITQIALSQPENGMLADLSGMMVRSDKVNAIRKARFEVDFIIGVDELKFPVKKIEALKSSKLRVHWLKNCGHMSIIEKPEETAAIILKYKC